MVSSEFQGEFSAGYSLPLHWINWPAGTTAIHWVNIVIDYG
jgi:hypothetical protein